MFDDQTTSRWIPNNSIGLPVSDYSKGAKGRSSADHAPWSAELDPADDFSPESQSWMLAADVARMRHVPKLPLWLRALVPGVALFAATLFGSVILFVQPSASPKPPAARASAPEPEAPHAPAAPEPSAVHDGAADPSSTEPAVGDPAAARATKPARTASRPASAPVMASAPASRTAAAAGTRHAARGALGMLRINSRPWSRVFVDGRPVGHTPILGLPLSAGEHEVELVNEALAVRKTVRVKIRPDEVVTKIVLLVE